jgi:sporulation and spore germination protein
VTGLPDARRLTPAYREIVVPPIRPQSIAQRACRGRRGVGRLPAGLPSLARRMLAVGMLAALAIGAGCGEAASTTRATGPTPLLVGIRTAHHSRFDRIVFQFTGALPARRQTGYVDRLIADPSGRAVSIAGRAILRVSFFQAAAHDTAGRPTAPTRAAFDLPNIMAVVRSGDFESVVSYGIGLAERTPVHVFTLSRPSRVVIDIGTAFRTVTRAVYFFNQRRFVANTPPFVTKVRRTVRSIAPATGLMDRLFAGPTTSEYAAGLRLLQSKATGYTGLTISGGVARIRLTGGCSSGGSTVSISDEIVPTLKQLPGIRYVKVYDPSGHTEIPTRTGDSRPACLEP